MGKALLNCGDHSREVMDGTERNANQGSAIRQCEGRNGLGLAGEVPSDVAISELLNTAVVLLLTHLVTSHSHWTAPFVGRSTPVCGR